MEVTSKNFPQALAKVTEFLPNADFVSFDTELTGLGTSSENKYTDLDTVEERYQKARKAVVDHGMIQFGITLFRFCASKKKYFSSSFCFFLAGKKDGCYKYDVSGMRFLAGNGFDFNKLFLDGLHFMTITDEHDIRLKRDQKLVEELVLPSPIKSMDKDAKKFVKESLKKVEESKLKGAKHSFPGSSLSSFHRKLLYNNVASQYPTSLFKSTRNSERNIEVTHFDSLQAKDAFVSNLWEEDLLERMGFMRVIRLLLESGKPLITHNGLLDILHFLDKFISPLPETFEDFQLLCKANIPPFYDTKLLAKDPPFSAHIFNSSLGNLYEELSTHFSPPEIAIEQGCDSYKITEDTGQEHNAGYDAFMTGVCLLVMLKHLDGPKWASSHPMKSKHLLGYCNKINFMFSYDHAYIDLYEKQVSPDRSHLLTIVCPSTFTMADSRKLLKNISSYKIIWIKDTKFHVVVENSPDSKEMASLVKDLSSICPTNVFVSNYKLPDLISNSNKKRVVVAAAQGKTALPGPLTRKRSSEYDSICQLPSGDNLDSDEMSAARSLKRLKSVGSSALSQMTLESPTQETIPQTQDNETAKSEASSNAFNVPDEW